MTIILKNYEIRMASEVGFHRYLISRFRGFKERNHSKRSPIDISIDGAIGEYACAKYLNITWSGSINTFKAPDLEPDIQVRSGMTNRIAVRPNDNPDERYVMVKGSLVETFRHWKVVGWCYGRDAKQDKYLDNPGNEIPAWFVPEMNLNSMGTFKIER